MRMDVKKLGGILGLMTGAAAVTPDEAEAAVYSKDGRRLLDLLNKAASGTLDVSEPPLEYYGVIPKDIFASIQSKDPSFTSPRLGSYEDDIFHYWNAHHNHMSNEEIENALELITNGTERYHTKGNEPYPVGIGAVGDQKSYNASLKAGEEFTRVYQLNPIKKRRLFKKIEEPSENAGWRSNTEEPSIPSSNSAEKAGLRSEHISADGVSDDSNIPEIDALRKGLLPLFAGGAGAAALAPGEAQAAQDNAGGASSWQDDVTRGLGLGTRNVIEGLGDFSDTFLNQPVNAVGRLFGYDIGLVNPGRELADAMGLPVPETDLEKNMAYGERGAASAVPEIVGGAGVAKMAASSVARIVGRELSSTPRRDIVISGLLSRFLGGD